MMLHIINKSPLTNSLLRECLNVCSDDCSILFIEDATFAVLGLPSEYTALIDDKKIKLYALEADLLARGLINKTPDHIRIINDMGFVELTIQHHSSQSWY